MAFSASLPGRFDRQANARAGAVRFLQRFEATSAKRRSSVAAHAPIGQFQLAALHHPDPFVRPGCLGFLDHYANEVPFVRRHSFGAVDRLSMLLGTLAN
jgi:hypothetical protein